jgi:hypothetical protein
MQDCPRRPRTRTNGRQRLRRSGVRLVAELIGYYCWSFISGSEGHVDLLCLKPPQSRIRPIVCSATDSFVLASVAKHSFFFAPRSLGMLEPNKGCWAYAFESRLSGGSPFGSCYIHGLEISQNKGANLLRDDQPITIATLTRSLSPALL